ncbi:hypothetical protein GF376_04915 [Candidatus Peregrinibacteria bacterium]|nr:hypothetical protein [Candidatus Peregrinibacteria bacterium]
MNRSLIKTRVQKFLSETRNNNLPVTPQKLAIFEYIASTDKHPMAEDILKNVRKKFPNLSDGTIYKNLKKFKSLHLIHEIDAPDGKRYDANIEPHDHLINLDTGEIHDIKQTSQFKLPKNFKNLTLYRASVTYYTRSK